MQKLLPTQGRRKKSLDARFDLSADKAGLLNAVKRGECVCKTFDSNNQLGEKNEF